MIVYKNIAHLQATGDAEAGFAMLKDLIEIGVSIDELHPCDKIDLEIEHIQMTPGDGFAEAAPDAASVKPITEFQMISRRY
jgi:hypothetical protein|tara:strand:+ start:4406 stop:4648 length:243 start_codon:yes stop_codon:yes gene_type:complete